MARHACFVVATAYADIDYERLLMFAAMLLRRHDTRLPLRPRATLPMRYHAMPMIRQHAAACYCLFESRR